MEIIYNEENGTKSITFEDLKPGDVFGFDRKIFIKKVEDSDEWNAYEFVYNDVATFEDELEVTYYPDAKLILGRGIYEM